MTPRPWHGPSETRTSWSDVCVIATSRSRPVLGYVFDDTALVSLGGGDHRPGALLAALDKRNIRVSIPAVTLSYAFAVLPPAPSVELLGIIEAMPNAAVEPLSE